MRWILRQAMSFVFEPKPNMAVVGRESEVWRLTVSPGLARKCSHETDSKSSPEVVALIDPDQLKNLTGTQMNDAW